MDYLQLGGHFVLIYGYEDTNKSGQCDSGDRLKIYDPYLYAGKFNVSTRRGKATVEGNTVYVEKETFRTYANYSQFFAFENNREDTKENTNSNISTATYTRYVKVNSSLNVRSGAGINYSYIRSLYNGNKVVVYEEVGNWSRIGENEWVCSDYLTNSNSIEATNNNYVKNTVGEYRKLKSTTILYSNSDLTGTKYTYLPNTTVKILKNISSTVDYVYIKATNRYAYINIYAYTVYNNVALNNLVGKTKVLKSNTNIYAYKTMSGKFYSYLPNTRVRVLQDLGYINYIEVIATKRRGYVYENVYK